MAIDPAAGKIYWANFGSNGIRVGEPGRHPVPPRPCSTAVRARYAGWRSTPRRTRSTGPTSAPTRSASATWTDRAPPRPCSQSRPEARPSGVAIDPATNKIYWTNQFTDQVRVGNLDGSGTASTLFGGANEDNPIGVAIDPAAGKIYWTNLNSGTVRVGTWTASGTASTLFGSENSPGGVAIDPAAGKIYWDSFFGGTIRVGNLDGSGTASTLFGPGGSNPLFAALLRAPVGTEPPAISSGVGEGLSCSQGSWAPDLLGAFLFRAPQSFAYQWLREGRPIAGATEQTFTPTEPGPYTCRVTASNDAGSASQTSGAFFVRAHVPAHATLNIVNFYDANANGWFDAASESTIAGWKVQVDGGAYLTPQSLTVHPGGHRVTEWHPVQTHWLHTNRGSVQVSLAAGDKATVKFANVCVGAGGARSTGFWSNKNGQALFGADGLALMVSLNLRNANGTAFDPGNYSQVKNWLLKANTTNMAYILSAQLAAMELNVHNGKVSGRSLIHAPGTTSANAAGFATVNAVMAEANNELGLHGLTKSGSPYRSSQTALKNALVKANNNLTFVKATPCAFRFG